MLRPYHCGVALAAMLALSAVGCEGASSDGLNRQVVWGKITLDGAPLPKGVIAFDPAEGQAGAVSVGGVIVDGAYNIDREQGPPPGKYRVSIRAAGASAASAAKDAPGMPPRKAAKDPIPAKYNAKSTLTADVKNGGSTEASFALTSE